MMAGRRVAGGGLVAGRAVSMTVDGRPLAARLGQTVAAALMAEDELEFRRTGKRGDSRGLFCGMGVCFDCLVVVDGVPNTRACVTWVRDAMVVDRQQGAGEPLASTGERPGKGPTG